MTKIMKTLWDESSELESEALSTRSVLSDDYTSGDIKEVRDTIEGGNQEAKDLDEPDAV